MKTKIRGITQHIRKILQRYPHSKPKEIARLLFNKVGKDYFSDEREFYLQYRNFIKTEKWAWNKWLRSDVLGRLPKRLKGYPIGSHKIEWEFESPLSQVLLQKINEVSRNLRPGLRDPRPVDKWYVIPNRNRMREFHNHHITVRVFPKSGTCRIIPSRPMSWEELVVHLERALYLGGLSLEESEAQARSIVPHARHRIFPVGRVDPFRIEYYKKSLGLTIYADGSHPQHIEVDESFPAWIPPLLRSNNRIVEAMTEFAKQIEAHLQVLKDIGEASREQSKSIREFTEAIKNFQEILIGKSSGPHKSSRGSSPPEYEV